MNKESKPNEEQDWKAQRFERLDNFERRLHNIQKRFELRMDKLETKIEMILVSIENTMNNVEYETTTHRKP